MFGLIYFVGFFLGSILQYAIFGHLVATYILLGSHADGPGVLLAAGGAAACAVVGFLLRLWASSYHAPGVVWSRAVVADRLTVAGPYRFVRNPLYLGTMLLSAGIGAVGAPTTTIAVVLLSVAFVYRLIAVEEAYLSAQQPNAFREYCASVPRLLPRLLPRLRAVALGEDDLSPSLAAGLFTELFALGMAAAMVYLAIAVALGLRPSVPVFWSILVLGFVAQSFSRRFAKQPEEFAA